MAVRLDKPWIPLTAKHIHQLTGHLGVYQLANDNDEIVYIGVPAPGAQQRLTDMWHGILETFSE